MGDYILAFCSGYHEATWSLWDKLGLAAFGRWLIGKYCGASKSLLKITSLQVSLTQVPSNTYQYLRPVPIPYFAHEARRLAEVCVEIPFFLFVAPRMFQIGAAWGVNYADRQVLLEVLKAPV